MNVNLVVSFYLFPEAIGLTEVPFLLQSPEAQMRQLLEIVRVISKLRCRLYSDDRR